MIMVDTPLHYSHVGYNKCYSLFSCFFSGFDKSSHFYINTIHVSVNKDNANVLYVCVSCVCVCCCMMSDMKAIHINRSPMKQLVLKYTLHLTIDLILNSNNLVSYKLNKGLQYTLGNTTHRLTINFLSSSYSIPKYSRSNISSLLHI